VLAGVAAVLLALAIAAVASANMPLGTATVRASVNAAGEPGNGQIMSGPRITPDGRYVTFYSDSDNLVPGDTNDWCDVFVRDLLTDTTTRVSVDSSGTQGSGGSSNGSISDDGRYVAFESDNRFVPGDTNGKADIYVRDRQTGETALVSVTTLGARAYEAYWPRISGDGRHVVFFAHFDTGEGLPPVGVYVRDLDKDTTSLVQRNHVDAPSPMVVTIPDISFDGRYVTYDEYTDPGWDVFRNDVQTGVNVQASVTPLGTDGNGDSEFPAISADGRYVVFQSTADDLVTGDTNGAEDIFVRDFVGEVTTRVSVSNSGVQAASDSRDAEISPDARYVAFHGSDGALVGGPVASGVFIHDRETHRTEQVTVAYNGGPMLGGAYSPSLSDNGAYVAYEAVSENLLSEDESETAQMPGIYVNAVDLNVTRIALAPWMVPKTSLGYTEGVYIDGTLYKSGWGMPGKTVYLQSASPGGAFSDTGAHAHTDAEGAFHFLAWPTKKTHYRIRFAGSAPYAASTSDGAFYVWPKAWVGRAIAPSTMKRSKAATVYGYLKPRHSAGSYPVRIYKDRLVAGKWVSYGYDNAKAANYRTYSKYSRSIKLTVKGRWRLRAYAPDDSGHAATWSSGYDYVTVK
jgi:Tol biopolymer transport system component